jgi:hypothetical protein
MCMLTLYVFNAYSFKSPGISTDDAGKSSCLPKGGRCIVDANWQVSTVIFLNIFHLNWTNSLSFVCFCCIFSSCGKLGCHGFSLGSLG